MRKCGPKKYVWIVWVEDYEAAWPIGYFDSEVKAQNRLDAYKLNKKNFEQRKTLSRHEVF